jgi:hypothetical protein
MKPGSVIFDLAVAQGGNVEGSVPDQIVEKHGVKIVAHRNVPARLAADASALFRATSTTSSPPSGTRTRAAPCCPTRTKSSILSIFVTGLFRRLLCRLERSHPRCTLR